MIEKACQKISATRNFSDIFEGPEFKSPSKRPQVVEDFYSQFRAGSMGFG
jgi:hypothetical protein